MRLISRLTECRRLSAESGFWKTIWSALCWARERLAELGASGSPSSVTVPPGSGAVRPSRTRASVVFPLPDSPTSPSVSPVRTSTLTRSRAWIAWPPRWKVFETSRTSISGSPCPFSAGSALGFSSHHPRQRLGELVEVATRPPPRAGVVNRRRLGPAALLGQAAAVGEDAARRNLARAAAGSRESCPAWPVTWLPPAWGCSAAARRCRDGVGHGTARGPGPPRRARRRTARPTRSHILAITARLWLMNSSEVPNSSRSAEIRSSTSASTVASRAVVGSSRISSDGSAASAIAITDPLEHAARELVGIAPHDAGRIGDPSPWPASARPAPAPACARLPGDLEDLGHLAPDADRGVQRLAGLLVDHRDLAGPQAAQLLPLQGRAPRLPSTAIRPADDPSVAGQIAHNRPGRRSTCPNPTLRPARRPRRARSRKETSRRHRQLAPPDAVGDFQLLDASARRSRPAGRRRRNRPPGRRAHRSSAPSIESDTKFTATISEAMASASNSTSHQ